MVLSDNLVLRFGVISTIYKRYLVGVIGCCMFHHLSGLKLANFVGRIHVFILFGALVRNTCADQVIFVCLLLFFMREKYPNTTRSGPPS